MRIRVASMPATSRKNSPYIMYIRPSFLWSTVTSQEWIWSKIVFSAVIEPEGIAPVKPQLLLYRSFECSQVSHQFIQIGIVEIHCGHQHARFEPLRGLDPFAQSFWRIRQGARAESVATHQMGEVRSKASISHSAINRMTIDTGGALENQPPGSRVRS